MSGRARRAICALIPLVVLAACFEIIELRGPAEAELGETVDYVLTFRATEESQSDWIGEVWWEVPRGWDFVSGEYEGVAGGVPISGELTPNPLPPELDFNAGCFGGRGIVLWAMYRQSATFVVAPPATVGDTGTVTLRFRVGGASAEFMDAIAPRFSASVRSGGNYYCGPGEGAFYPEMDITVREPSDQRFTRKFVPQAGSGRGAGGAVFDTAVVAFNPGGSDRNALMSEWPGDWGGQVVLTRQPEVLKSGQLIERTMSDTFDGHVSELLQAFGASPFGMVQTDFSTVGPFGGPEPMMQAVIFATIPDGRRFGQFFQGRPEDSALRAGETGLLFTTHDPQRYRVNVGVVAMSDDASIVFTPRGAGGTQLSEPIAFTLYFKGLSQQFNNIYSRWNLGTASDVMVEARVESGAAFVYGSVLDGRGDVPGTSDPTTILPATGGSTRVVLFELGRITGLNEFSGSSSIYNHGPDAAVVHVDFYERGVPGVADSTSLTIGGREAISWDDAVGELMGRTEVVGALVFTIEDGQGGGGGLSAIGREFAIYREGGEVTGTAGQAIPGLVDDDMLMPGETFHFIGLRERDLEAGPERSHLGLLNLGSTDSTVRISGFADDGTPEGIIWITVRAGEQKRVNRILTAINPEQDGGLKRLEVTATAPVHALAYRVNSNGDPVTILPFRR